MYLPGEEETKGREDIQIMKVIGTKQFVLWTMLQSRKTAGQRIKWQGSPCRRNREYKYYMQPAASFWNLLSQENIKSSTMSRFVKEVG